MIVIFFGKVMMCFEDELGNLVIFDNYSIVIILGKVN